MMKKILFTLSLMITTWLHTEKTLAQEAYENIQTVQDLGRGGVTIPWDTDARSMLYNPAMLSHIKGIRWTFVGLQAGTSGGSTMQLLQNSPIGPATLNQYYGKNIWAGYGGFSALAMPNLGIAAYGNYSMDFMLTNPVTPSMNIENYLDYGFWLGYSYSITKNLSMGIAFKRITRRGGSTTLGTATILDPGFNQNTILNAVSNVGTGYGGDLGLVWKGDSALNPTLSINWHDVGYTYFYPAVGQQGPPPIMDNLVLGYTISQQGGAGIGWGAGLEYRHIRNVEYELSKKIHLGAELNLSFIDLRAGLYQGWTTYGASVDLWVLSLDAATYKIERGVYAGQQGDERVQIGITFEAGFDANFNLTDAGGKRRRLKQRR